MRCSEIVYTLGPATSSKETIRDLIEAGANVLRVNRSHDTREEDEAVIAMACRVSANFDQPAAILVDLQGPKIRLGAFANGSEELVKGQDFTTTTHDIEGDSKMVSTTYKGLPGDCSPGDELLTDDGNIRLRVTRMTKTEVQTAVEVPGRVPDHKGLNLPGVGVSVPTLSEKDTGDLHQALKQDVDFIALSFVRRAQGIEDVHQIMDEVGRRPSVIAKIEKPQAVENLKEIIQASDAMMVTREDLSVEMPLQEVPTIQKRVIELSHSESKLVIIATQVSGSMAFSSRPIRAEASGCANAVWDGASAVILSGEATVGAYPVEAVKAMAKIVESAKNDGARHFAEIHDTDSDLGSIIAYHGVLIAQKTGARFVATFTNSGATARRLARLRPVTPPYAFCYHEEIRRQLQLTRGIKAYPVTLAQCMYTMIHDVERVVLAKSLAEKGDVVIYVGGLPPGQDGHTNSIRIHFVGSKDDV